MDQNLLQKLHNLVDMPQPKARFTQSELEELLRLGLVEGHDEETVYDDDVECICITGAGLAVLSH